MLPILYQDKHLVVVYKPAGMLVHRSFRAPQETEFLLQRLRDQLGQRVYPVHRLDRPTAGLLVFALDADSARRLTESFTERGVQKSYLAIVRGHVQAAGEIDYPLQEQLDDYDDPRTQLDKDPQPARTSYVPLAQVTLPIAIGRYPEARYSLLRLHPHTGRQHQLRRHLKHIFHPIVGDTSYGEGRHNRLFREHFAWQRLALASLGLGFYHPYSGEWVDVQSAPDAELLMLLDKLGWSFAVTDLTNESKRIEDSVR